VGIQTTLVEYKSFSANEKVIAESIFLCNETIGQNYDGKKLVAKKVSFVALQTPKLGNKLKSMAFNPSTGVLYASEAETKTIYAYNIETLVYMNYIKCSNARVGKLLINTND
jgi:hypothetical protein